MKTTTFSLTVEVTAPSKKRARRDISDFILVSKCDRIKVGQSFIEFPYSQLTRSRMPLLRK